MGGVGGVGGGGGGVGVGGGGGHEVLRHVRRAVRDLSDHRAALEKQLHDSERKVKCDTCMHYSRKVPTQSLRTGHRTLTSRPLCTFEGCV